MSNTISIAAMFRGPPHSGNGGYVAGVIAAAVMQRQSVSTLNENGGVEVTLRAPTPLDQPLRVVAAIDSVNPALSVVHGDTLIAEAKWVPLQMSIPVPATWDDAMRVRELSYSLPLGEHPFFEGIRRGAHPICFCCGAELSETQGLQVYSAPIHNNEQVAAAWIPNACFVDANRNVRPEFIWTALDCPGQMAWRARDIRTGMLGRFTARIEKTVRAGERCVVIGWTMANEGKKYFAGTALFNEANELCAYAKAVWIGRFP